MKTKKVVIFKESFYRMPPYWFQKYMKLKGIDIYCYHEVFQKDHTVKFHLIENSKTIEKQYLFDFVVYLDNNYGEVLTYEEFDRKNQIFISNYTEDREDEDLINIAKEINDENIIKIIEIPVDIEYDIWQNECDCGEHIRETHRTWS